MVFGTTATSEPSTGKLINNLQRTNCFYIIFPIDKISKFFFQKIQILGIHCEWSEWAVGRCSAECGTGTRFKTRSKIIEEANGGTCTGNTTENETCKDKECPCNEFSLSV